jgi:hypothetical protein
MAVQIPKGTWKRGYGCSAGGRRRGPLRRKSTWLLLAVVALAWLLSSCRPALPTATATPSKAAKGPTTSARQPSATVTQTSVALPQEWIASTPVRTWKDIPVMPGASAGGEKGGYYLYVTSGVPSDGAAFYSKEMQGLGWKPRPTNGTPEAGVVTLVFTKAQETCTIGLIPQKGGILVMIGRLGK